MRSRLATLAKDFWQLDSGEERHKRNPESFWIPEIEARANLQRGQAAKLLFMIEAEDDGRVEVMTERMWVICKRREGPYYVGVLDNRSALVGTGPEDKDFLPQGMEVVFLPEHIIDIETPPKEYVVSAYGESFFA